MTVYHPIDRPTKPGWYWFAKKLSKRAKTWNPHIVNVWKSGDRLVAISTFNIVSFPIDEMKGVWYGPRIPEPT